MLYQHAQYRAQAASRGIPFIDLKNLSLLELQLYLLPVFRCVCALVFGGVGCLWGVSAGGLQVGTPTPQFRAALS